MIILAGIVPHHPLLVPSLAPSGSGELGDTATAIGRLADCVERARPDVIAVLSSHHGHGPGMVVRGANTLHSDLRRFGDHSLEPAFTAHQRLATRIASHAGLSMDRHRFLEYGFAVPLILLGQGDSERKVLPIGISHGHTLAEHANMGGRIGEVLADSKRRVAVLAAGELSKAHGSDGPLPFSAKGAMLDKKVTAAIRDLSLTDIQSVDPVSEDELAACLLRPLAALTGMLPASPALDFMAYETAFGTGFCTACITSLVK